MAKNEIRWRRRFGGSLLEIEKAWINLLLIKRGKIMEIWKFENFLSRRSWNREKLEEVFIEYASTDLNSKRREFFASNYCCNGVEQQQITIWNGVKRFTTYLRDIARGDRLAETVNKSVTQYSWRNTINKTRATIDQNLFESNQPIARKSRIFITTSIWNYFKISFKRSTFEYFSLRAPFPVCRSSRYGCVIVTNWYPTIYRENPSRFSWKRR